MFLIIYDKNITSTTKLTISKFFAKYFSIYKLIAKGKSATIQILELNF